jgi:hypothetical protein
MLGIPHQGQLMDAQKIYTPTRTWVMVRVRGHNTEVECAELTAEELQDRLDSGWFVNPVRSNEP